MLTADISGILDPNLAVCKIRVKKIADSEQVHSPLTESAKSKKAGGLCFGSSEVGCVSVVEVDG